MLNKTVIFNLDILGESVQNTVSILRTHETKDSDLIKRAQNVLGNAIVNCKNIVVI